MRITAVMAWYDEPLELLAQAVTSLVGVADHLVALDGRWEGFPGRAGTSPPEQALLIQRTAAAIGLDGVVVTTGEVFPSQVAKRSTLFRLAPDDTDWLLVIDADEHIWSCDRAALDAALAAASEDVAQLPLTNLARQWPHDQLPVHTYQVRRLFRAAAQPRYEIAHNGVRSSSGAWLSGDPMHVELAPAADLAGAIALGHACDARPTGRHRQRSTYYAARRADRLEDWSAVV